MTRAPIIREAGPYVGGSSPWDRIQHVTPLGDGIIFASTAGHGGYWIPRAVLGRIPEAEQAYAASWSGSRQWFEEDCCALSVVLAFPEWFPDLPARDRAEYRRSLDGYMMGEPERRGRVLAAAHAAALEEDRDRILYRHITGHDFTDGLHGANVGPLDGPSLRRDPLPAAR